MKRYRLKKDLPNIRAGAEFKLNNKGDLVLSGGDRDSYGPFIPGVYTLYCRPVLDICPNILTDWFEEIPEKTKTVYDLKYGDECWMRGSNLQPLKIEWRGTPYDNQLRELGLIFLSKEDLEKDNIWQRARQILLRDTRGFKPDWRDETQQKYTVYFDSCYGYLCTDFWCTYLSSSIYFATEEGTEASIKAHEKEWKIYLGVEE